MIPKWILAGFFPRRQARFSWFSENSSFRPGVSTAASEEKCLSNNNIKLMTRLVMAFACACDVLASRLASKARANPGQPEPGMQVMEAVGQNKKSKVSATGKSVNQVMVERK